jgi:hypothetical protein
MKNLSHYVNKFRKRLAERQEQRARAILQDTATHLRAMKSDVPAPPPRHAGPGEGFRTGIRDSALQPIRCGDVILAHGKTLSYLGKIVWNDEKSEWQVKVSEAIHRELKIPRCSGLVHVIRVSLHVLVVDKEKFGKKIE